MSNLQEFFYISYSPDSAEDTHFALRLAKDLRAWAINIWIDHPDLCVGEAQRIAERAPGMFVILSPDAIKSERVRRELSIARAHGKWIEGILFRDCQLTRLFDFRRTFDFRYDYDTAFKALREFLGESPWTGGGGPTEDSEALLSVESEQQLPAEEEAEHPRAEEKRTQAEREGERQRVVRAEEDEQQRQSAIVGGLRVTVMDPTGAVVCNATVTAADQARDFTSTVTSNSIGVSEFLLLMPGQYTVSIQSPGFSKQINSRVRVTIGEVAELPVTLSVAASNTTVEVWAPQPVQSEQTAASSKHTAKKKAGRKLARVRPPRAHVDYEPPAEAHGQKAAPPAPSALSVALPAPTPSATAPAPEPQLSPGAVPSPLIRDNVQFTLTGPAALAPGEAHELLFWVHVEEQRTTVLVRAAAELGLSTSEMAVNSEGPYPLARGSLLSVRLTIAGLNCVDDHKWIVWTGEIGKTTFIVDVPAGTAEGKYIGSASIRLNDCEIAKMSFLVRVGRAHSKVEQLPATTTAHRQAFASYASEDRVAVLSRVQGMEAAWKGLDVFVDVMSLRSGQNWQPELVKRISEADVFYLFWCRHAQQSEWVSKEWRLALQARGQDFIDPVPLESPQEAPPPPELEGRHFNDPVLAFIVAAGGHLS